MLVDGINTYKWWSLLTITVIKQALEYLPLRRKCQSHLHWSEVGEKTTLGPDVLVKAEKKVGIARQHLVTAQSRQKLYSDKRNMTLSSKLQNRYS